MDHSGDCSSCVKKPEENFTGQIIRNIAHNANRSAILRCKFCKVDFENITMNEIQCITKALLKKPNRSLIHFNTDKFYGFIVQMFCQRTLTGTDFDNNITILKIKTFHNLIQDVFIP